MKVTGQRSSTGKTYSATGISLVAYYDRHVVQHRRPGARPKYSRAEPVGYRVLGQPASLYPPRYVSLLDAHRIDATAALERLLYGSYKRAVSTEHMQVETPM